MIAIHRSGRPESLLGRISAFGAEYTSDQTWGDYASPPRRDPRTVRQLAEDAGIDVLERHYDRRSQIETLRQRRQYFPGKNWTTRSVVNPRLPEFHHAS